ncbi:ABC transporter ATP-binding protein [Rurimicrobium arvi]|uniref:ABC transporter ATP-binding protein n=1 Tax=Rurimicrobium arvi TaxID=2049916 RepID=A0ABP8MTX6_9BACT
MTIIETQHLSKRFGSFQAVDDLSFSIKAGDVYGFLGQNGAGKSTTMRMLLGLIRPDSGKIFIKGSLYTGKEAHLLSYIGAIIERPDMYGYLSGWDNLKIFARLSFRPIPDSRLYEILELVGLRGREQDKVRAYSQGMKQRLGIAIAMVHNPELLILDEPTNGLDPQGIAEMRQLIKTLSADYGKTILVSSHLLYEIEQVATRMIIIHKGKKIVEGSVSELLNPSETLIEINWNNSGEALQQLSASRWSQAIQSADTSRLLLKMHPDEVPQLNRLLVSTGADVLQIRSRHSLEDYFIQLTHDAADPHRAL